MPIFTGKVRIFAGIWDQTSDCGKAVWGTGKLWTAAGRDAMIKAKAGMEKDSCTMGSYLNPGNERFQRVVNSEIYVDKTGLLRYTNKKLNSTQQNICVSRPRRFGKSERSATGTEWICRSFGNGITVIGLNPFPPYTPLGQWLRRLPPESAIPIGTRRRLLRLCACTLMIKRPECTAVKSRNGRSKAA